jgi:dTDP-glucose pyrophosphorylase
MTNTSLIILAAGIGSRYGGTKQLDPVTPAGDTIIDFSLYDAISAGFSKVIFVIRESIREEFKAAFDKKLEGHNIEIYYAEQEVDSVPGEFLPTARKKPWGTGHALLMAEDIVTENFCVINADDFYGREAFVKMFEFLQREVSPDNDLAMVGYRLENTLSENGSVSRGLCRVDENDFLEEITERTKIYQSGEKIVCLDQNNSEVSISPGTIASMNFWGFTSKIFETLRIKFKQFLKSNSNDEQAEFLLPEIVNHLIEEKRASVKLIKTKAKWMGITYREDKKGVSEKIKELQEKGVYPKELWQDFLKSV